MFQNILDYCVPDSGGILNGSVHACLFALFDDIDKAASLTVKLKYLQNGMEERGKGGVFKCLNSFDYFYKMNWVVYMGLD